MRRRKKTKFRINFIFVSIVPDHKFVESYFRAAMNMTFKKTLMSSSFSLQDPRETLIVSLKREIEALQKENEHLRTALDMNNTFVEKAKKSSGMRNVSNRTYLVDFIGLSAGIYIFPLLIHEVIYFFPETYKALTAIKPVNEEKLGKMSTIELVDLIKHYAADNEALRKENFELFHSRDMMMRDHEIVCHENERLIKKVENQCSSAKLYQYLMENVSQA